MAYTYNPAGAARFKDDGTSPLQANSPSIGALDAGLNPINYGGNVFRTTGGGARDIDIDGFQSALINDDYCSMSDVSAHTCADNATTSIWVTNSGAGGSGGFHAATVNYGTSGFPAYPGTRYARLAVVVCAGGVITSITDKRPRSYV